MELLDSSLEELWDTLDEGAELVSCSNINGLYRSAVWDELCGELPKGLMVLLVSCILLSAVLVLLVREAVTDYFLRVQPCFPTSLSCPTVANLFFLCWLL